MDNVTTPTLLLDEHICRSNIKSMAEKASRNSLLFKPHMKTHQSAEVGQWLSDFDIEAITVSSVQMAQYFTNNGWKDITIAFPCNVREATAINDLAKQVSLTILINKTETVDHLDNRLTESVNTYIEIDTGSGRTGLDPKNIEDIKTLISSINESNSINWIGFYSHPGHSYDCQNRQEVTEVHQSVLGKMQTLRNHFESNFGTFEICLGDTPCCSVANNFDSIDAISPGNFVFYDLMQLQIGSCKEKQIAVAMACPVVDKYPQRNELVIHGGAVHFSKDYITHQAGDHYGLVAERSENSWQIVDQQSHLSKLSQEHGTLKASDGVLASYNIGDVIYILPIHSCLTANLMQQYRLTNGTLIDQM